MRIFVYLGITISPLVIKYFLEKIYNTTKCLSVKDYNSCGTLFTTLKNYKCRTDIFQKVQCSRTCSYAYLIRIINCIENATKSISLCVYLLTLNEICSALIRATSRGILVRLISDNEMMEMQATKKNILLNSGCCVASLVSKYN